MMKTLLSPPTAASQSGNVLVLILIVVALFAALSMAISQSGQGGNASLGEDKAGILASEVSDYGVRLSNALSKLRINGCTLSEISFENNVIEGYENGGADPNQRCFLFSAAGGGLNWPHFSPDLFDTTWLENDKLGTKEEFGQPIFTLRNEVPAIGIDQNGANSLDLIMLLQGLKPVVCKVMNQRAMNSDDIPAADPIKEKYIGNIANSGTYFFPAALFGQRHGCFEDQGGADKGTLTYYYVLIMR